MGKSKKRHRDDSSDEKSGRNIKKRLDPLEKLMTNFFDDRDYYDRREHHSRRDDRDYRHRRRYHRHDTPGRYDNASRSEVYDSSDGSRSYSCDRREDEFNDHYVTEDPKDTTQEDVGIGKTLTTDKSVIPAKDNDSGQLPQAQSTDTTVTVTEQSTLTQSTDATVTITEQSTLAQSKDATVPSTEEMSGEQPLDQVVLKAIGDLLEPDRVLLPAIHKDLAIRVEEIINKGLPVAERKTLLKKFPPPKNGLFMDPPKLNFEIKTNLAENIVKRDDRIVEKQARVSAGLSGLTKLMSMSLQLPQDQKLAMLEILGGVSRILADLQHEESEIRRSLILKNIDPSKRDILKSTVAGDCCLAKLYPRAQKGARLEGPDSSHITEVTVQLDDERAKTNTSSEIVPEPQATEEELPAIEEITSEFNVSCPAGRLKFFYRALSEITSDKTILSWVRGFKIPFARKVFQFHPPSEPHWSEVEKVAIRQQLDELFQLIPSKRCKFLGLVYDSKKMIVELLLEKTNRVTELVRKFERTKKYKIREFAAFIGTLESCSPTLKYGRVHMRDFERARFLALRNSNDNYDRYIFCKINEINPLSCTIPNVLVFLTSQYNQGATHGTLNSFRSAIALIYGPNFGENPEIKRFFKEVSKLRPPRPNVGDKAIEIKIPENIKTSKLNRNQPVLSIPFYPDNALICPAT
ncbi:Protein of unknown function, partial [Cotesia congregata]